MSTDTNDGFLFLTSQTFFNESEPVQFTDIIAYYKDYAPLSRDQRSRLPDVSVVVPDVPVTDPIWKPGGNIHGINFEDEGQPFDGKFLDYKIDLKDHQAGEVVGSMTLFEQTNGDRHDLRKYSILKVTEETIYTMVLHVFTIVYRTSVGVAA